MEQKTFIVVIYPEGKIPESTDWEYMARFKEESREDVTKSLDDIQDKEVL